MNYTKLQWWERFQKYYTEFPDARLGGGFEPDERGRRVFHENGTANVKRRSPTWRRWRSGAIANPDENRMVGHYWLRNPALAPTPEIRKEIEETTSRIKDFAAKVHAGEIRGQAARSKIIC